MLLDEEIISNLRSVSGDDMSFLVEIIDIYIQQAPELIKVMQDSYYSNDVEELARSAHTFKGASLNIGAAYLAGICKDIEQKIKENDYENIEGLLGLIGDIFPETVTALLDISKPSQDVPNNPEPPPDPPGNSDNSV
jgi:HPt (histidine-containing phosphotransfer) domain-containing protein